jgi:hypothetical protein
MRSSRALQARSGEVSRRGSATDSQTRDIANIVEHSRQTGGIPDTGVNMNKLKRSMTIALLLTAAASAQAQVGVLQGTVTGVKAGTVLPVFKGDAKVADIKVEEGGKFSVPLATGAYTVNCPGGKVIKVAALNGAATISINCQ